VFAMNMDGSCQGGSRISNVIGSVVSEKAPNNHVNPDGCQRRLHVDFIPFYIPRMKMLRTEKTEVIVYVPVT
jgi:hypothetical protein